jgi:hypothetical protein
MTEKTIGTGRSRDEGDLFRCLATSRRDADPDEAAATGR